MRLAAVEPRLAKEAQTIKGFDNLLRNCLMVKKAMNIVVVHRRLMTADALSAITQTAIWRSERPAMIDV
jgi:hypothetical protein